MLITFRTLDSPIGTLLLAATDLGVVRLAFSEESVGDVLDDLTMRIGAAVIHDPSSLDRPAAALDRYFAGSGDLDDLAVDLRLTTPFRRSVLEALRRIPYASTASYAEVAASVGRPKATRAVGTACATNPVPLIVPCHRVVRSGGALGNYGGGLATKRWLLELETRSHRST